MLLTWEERLLDCWRGQHSLPGTGEEGDGDESCLCVHV